VEVVALGAALELGRVAEPGVVALRGARHVARERRAARLGLALEALDLDAPARDLARAQDVVLGRVLERAVARRLRGLQVGVERFHQRRRGLRRERLAQLAG